MVTHDFNYLIDKVRSAPFKHDPFKHIHLSEFLSKEHFDAIVACKEISLKRCENDTELFDALYEVGYEMVPFPGAVVDDLEYIKARQNKKSVAGHHSACESQGVVLRLSNPSSEILVDLKAFIQSDDFNSVIAEKFGVPYNDVRRDAGIQKYLDEYEISPHPDMRKKALTFMVNINPSPTSEHENHHTHYLRFKAQKEYVQKFWEGNPTVERCWVPWDWCDSVKQQSDNNSIVIFSPSHDTLHAVKASYCHLNFQRTQMYGNLWSGDNFDRPISNLDWSDFELSNRNHRNNQSPIKRLSSSILRLSKRAIGRGTKPVDKTARTVDRTRSGNY
jgi:hypothetical protein